jgi:predicted outer membrane lipoprotein
MRSKIATTVYVVGLLSLAVILAIVGEGTLLCCAMAFWILAAVWMIHEQEKNTKRILKENDNII